MALAGLLEPGIHNRFPLTWTDRASKVDRIKPWTATAEDPRGSSQSAEAILDFMTCDWAKLAVQLQSVIRHCDRAGKNGLSSRWVESRFSCLG